MGFTSASLPFQLRTYGCSPVPPSVPTMGATPRARQDQSGPSLMLSDSNFPPLRPSLQTSTSSTAPCRSSVGASGDPLVFVPRFGSLSDSDGLQALALVPGPPPVSPEPGSLVISSSGGPGFELDRIAGASEERHQSLTRAPGLDLSASGRLLAHRLSPRLAAKNWGSKKSSLLKAQDLKCKKLKRVRFASEVDRSAPLSVFSAARGESSSPSSSKPSGSTPPVAPSVVFCPEPSPRRGRIFSLR